MIMDKAFINYLHDYTEAFNDDELDFDFLLNEYCNLIDERCSYDNLYSNVSYTYNKHNELNILHLNVQSLLNKFDKFKQFILDLSRKCGPPDFILVCETFLKDNIIDLVKLDGYKFIHRSRNVKKGGGVGVYIRNNIDYSICENLSYNIDDEFESIFVKFDTYLIGEVYRSPNSSDTISVDRYEALLNKCMQTGNNLIIGTDQNFNYLNIKSSTRCQELLNNFMINNTLPTIHLPTRLSHSSQNTLIDNIYIKNNELIYNSVVFIDDLSDHCPILTKLICAKNKIPKTSHTISYRHLSENAIHNIVTSLISLDLCQICQ